MFREERYLRFGDTQSVGRKVNTRLVALEHVQSEQQVHRLAFQYRERYWQEHVPKLNLRGVNTAENLRGSDTLSHSREPLVKESHDATGFSAFRRYWSQLAHVLMSGTH